MKTELWKRVQGLDDAETVGTRAVLVSDVLARLESGEAPSDVCRGLELEPLDLVAAVGFAALRSRFNGPPLIQERPRHPNLRSALAETGIPGLFSSASKSEKLGLAAGLLQIHDFWDESHQAAQTADDMGETKVSAYWHAIAHRREPDPGNASYWFRRVGEHPVFGPLADAATELLKDADRDLVGKLIPAGAWNPYAFIDGVTRQLILATTAAELQREEMRLLLAASIPS